MAVQKTLNLKLDIRLIFCILLFLGVLLRLFLLTNQSLWWDEGFSIYNSDGPSVSEMYSRVRNLTSADKFQPLYYWVLFFVRQVFGDSELVLRGLSVFLGILALPVIYFTAFRFYGKQHALWSLTLAVFSSLMIHYSQEVRNYSLIFFLAACQMYYLSEAISSKIREGKLSKLIFSCLTGLNFLCSVQTLVFSASLSVAHLLITRKFLKWLNWWLLVAIFCLPALIYYAILPGETDPGEVGLSRFGFPVIFNVAYVIYGLLVGTTFGPPQDDLRGDDKVSVIFNHLPEITIFGLVFALIFFSCLILFSQRFRKKSNFFEIDFFLLLTIAFTLIFGFILALVTKINWVPRHSFCIWLPLSILLPSLFCLPLSLDGDGKNVSKRLGIMRALSKGAVAALIVLNIYSSANYYFNPSYWRDDYRNISRYFIELQGQSVKTVLLNGEPRLLRYYGDLKTSYSDAGLVRKISRGDMTWVNDLKLISENSRDVVLAAYRLRPSTHADLGEAFSQVYDVADGSDGFKGFKLFHLKIIQSSPSTPSN